MSPDFRAQIKDGRLLIGTMITLSSPEVAEILADVGFDWLFVDTEHSPFDVQSAQGILQAAGDRCPCVLRVPSSDEVWIKKALDIGAAGIIVPQVSSARQAERIVAFAKYPPEGSRGVGLGRAHRYGLRFQEYLASANREVAVIVQAEHIQTVKNIATIVRVPGIDAIFVGPYDLSASLGKTGQVTHKAVLKAIDRVKTACLKAGVRLGIFGTTAAAVQPFIAQGFSLITVGTDTLFTASAAGATLAELKG
ncbi:MAG: hypothetical protein JSW39_01015 [Desulfobacterales bacterium]|nr:MAG: hypothetical protein JSW39_01015 [Desulfobacterales bacterium]